MDNKPKKFILCVQGEGRGHITQAITLYELLVEKGHTVCAVIVGSVQNRTIPSYMFEKITCPIVAVTSPNFVTDANNRSINLTRTILHNIGRLGTYWKSLREIDMVVKFHEPDIIINFYELLTSLYYRIFNPGPKMVCVAHQYIYMHRDYQFPPGHFIDRFLIRFYTRLTTSGSSKNLALSFYKIYSPGKNVIIVPPLLRKEIFTLSAESENFYLVYLVNNGYFADLFKWHRDNPGIKIHCFTDKPEILCEKYEFNREILRVHTINDRLFLDLMSRASGLASTAGFESVCEALFLGKPVLMVPIHGHYEQFCNSRDAYKVGAGVYSDRFDLSKLIHLSNSHKTDNTWFRNWVTTGSIKIYNELMSVR